MLVTFDLLTSVQFPSNPCLIRPIPWFLRQYFSSVFHCSGNVHGWVSIDCLCLWPRREHTQCENDGGGGWGHAGGEKYYAGVCAKSFWCVIYCSKTRHDTMCQSVYRSQRRLGRQALYIMLDYYLTTAIEIRPLNHLSTCERGYLSFSDMNWLKFVSTTRASLPKMLSTERKNGEKCFRCSWKWLPWLYFFWFSQKARSLSIGSFL